MPIYMKDGGGSSKSSGSSGSKSSGGSTPKPVVQPPKIWWFQGRSYASEAAYQAAVAANRAARSAAAAATRQAQDAARQRAAREAALRELQARRQRYVEQAQAAARAASERARNEQIRRAAEERKRQELRLAAERRAKATLELLSARRGGPREEQVALARRVQASDQQLAQQRLAEARSRAYTALGQQASSVLSQVGRRPAGVAMIDTPAKRVQTSPLIHRRNQLVTQAQQTGDWSTVIAELTRQSRTTNGRHVDSHLFNVLQEQYVAPIQAVATQFGALVEQMRSLEASGKTDELLRLLEDPGNIALYERFTELFGDGTSDGAFSEHQRALTEISEARYRAWTLGHRPTSKGLQGEEARLLRTASRQSSIRTRQLPGVHSLDDELTDLTYQTRVLDPETGKYKTVTRRGIDAWMAREQDRERERTRGLRRDYYFQFQQAHRLMDSDSYRLNSIGGGRVSSTNVTVAKLRGDVQRLLPQWQLNEHGIPARIVAAAGNPGLQEQLIRQFMADAAEAYDRQYGGLRERVAGNTRDPLGGVDNYTRNRLASMGRVPTAEALAQQNYDRGKYGWLSMLAAQLGKPGWTVLDAMSTTGLGGVFQGAMTAVSVIPAVLRQRLQQDFGDWQPFVNVDIGGSPRFWEEGANPLVGIGSNGAFNLFGLQFGRSFDPNAAKARAGLAATGQTGDFWTDLGAWASVVRDNAMWGDGNLGGILTQLTDPFALSGPGRFTQAGALAMARVGGLRGLRTGGFFAAEEMLKEFARYAAPKFIGGAGREAVKIELAKVALARKLGLSGSDALRLTDDEFRQIADQVALDRTQELFKSDVFKQLTQRTGIEKNQLLAMVQQELPDILREYRIGFESPFDTARRMAEIRQSAEAARSVAAEAEQLAKMQADRAEAMRVLAEETGRPLKASDLTPEQMARHDKAIEEYSAAAREYREAAEAGVKAAEAIESGAAAGDPQRLRTLQAQLRRHADTVAEFEDSYHVDRWGRKKLDRPGRITRRYRQLAEFRDRYGDPTSPSFVDSSIEQVQYDRQRIKGMMTEVRRQLAATPLDQPLSAELQARLKRLEAARRGLIYEEAQVDGGRRLMRAYAWKNIGRIEDSVSPQRIAPMAVNQEQLAVETARSAMMKLHDAKVRPIRQLSTRQAAAFDQLRTALSRPVDVVQLMGEETAKAVSKALGRDVTLGELWSVLRMAVADEVGFEEYGQLLKYVQNEVIKEARAVGLKFGQKKARQIADSLFDVLKDDHIRLGNTEVLGLEGYSALDTEVQGALQQWREWIAQGQVHLKERRFLPPKGPSESVFHDTDLFENLVKMRVLEGRGQTVFSYDEMRGVMGQAMVKKESARGVLERAVARMADDPRLTLDEAYRLELQATARREAIRNVEEFASRPGMETLAPEGRLRAFEERVMADDRPVGREYTISPFQEQALRKMFQEEAGFSFDEKHLISRYFRGEVELRAGARVPRAGEYRSVEGAENVQVGVVPADHEVLREQIPFGRPRYSSEGLDPETLRMLEEMEADLARQADERLPIDAIPEGNKPWLREEAGPELSEAATERRGAAAGRRQNAAAEARRSSRRNFVDGSGEKSGVVRRANRTYGFHEAAADRVPNWKANRDLWYDARESKFRGYSGHTREDYRVWLWDRINADPSFRADLKNLRGKNVVLADGWKAQTLAEAADWLWTDDAAKRFSRPQVHADLLARNSTPETRAAAMLKSKVDDKAAELREARRQAGQEFRVFVPRKWLDDVREYVEQERGLIDAYYHASGDRRGLSDVIEFLDSLVKGEAEDFDVTLGAGRTPGVVAPAAQLRKLDEVLTFQAPTSAGSRKASAAAPETFSSMLERKRVSGTWVGEANERILQLDQELKELRAELKAARKVAGASPAPPGRTMLHYTTPERAEALRSGRTMPGDSPHGSPLEGGPMFGRGLYLTEDEGWALKDRRLVGVPVTVPANARIATVSSAEEMADLLVEHGVGRWEPVPGWTPNPYAGKSRAELMEIGRQRRWLEDDVERYLNWPRERRLSGLPEDWGVQLRDRLAAAGYDGFEVKNWDVNEWGSVSRAFEAVSGDQLLFFDGRRLTGAPRYRGRVGVSITGDGVYLAEGTSDVTFSHEIFHQFWDDEFNAAWRGEIEGAIDLLGPELRTHVWRQIRVGSAAYDEAEFAAELYALWKVGDDVKGEAAHSWSDLRAMLDDDGRALLDNLGSVFESHAPAVVDSLTAKLRIPPLGNRSRLFRWMEENGYWSRRTGEAIRTGERAWSVREERQYFKSFMEYEPPWTDEDVLRVALNDPRLHEVMLRYWGVYDDEMEQLIASQNLTPEQVTDGLLWGKHGIKRQRTAEEMRRWAIERYGELVSEDGQNLIRLPWLMRADDEYLTWTARFFDDAVDVAQKPALERARAKLPEAVREALWDGDNLRSVGIQIDPTLVKAREVRKLRDAITRATRRRIERMIRDGDVVPGEWLAQEQLRFAYDVTDQLLVAPRWRGLLRGTPLLGQALHLWGQLWRTLVSFQPAFPIMNLLESYGFKRLYLTVFEGGFRPLSAEGIGRELVPDLRSIGAESHSLFGLSGGSPYARIGNKYLSLNERGGALIQGILEAPVRASAQGENALRLDFARRVAGDTYRAALKTGMSEENARWLARIEAKRLIDYFFATNMDSGWKRALNDLVPFFSYNWKQKTLALKMLWNHPQVWIAGERLRREIEAANREAWAREHPDLPFPEGPSASWLWWKVGDDYYKIDLSAFSDWTRAIGSVTRDYTPLEWFTEFIRVPHPSQRGALAMFTGGETPWGNPGSIRELSIWADLFYWLRGVDYSDPRRRRDGLQMLSQLLFFKKFAKIDAMSIKQMTYFSLRDQDKALAREYLEANPDLQLYWQQLPGRERIKGFDPEYSYHYRQLMSDAENAELDAAYEGWNALNDQLDANVAQYADRPWSDEYKQAKRDAFVARKVFLAENPVLPRTWATFMGPDRFSELEDRVVVDELADAWYNWKRPERTAFDSELEYQRAIVAFNERRAEFLEAHPALARRISEGRTAIETAWREQELHWTDVLDFQARLKIRILEEEARGDASDRDYIDLLYRARDWAGADLDADRFGMFESPAQTGGARRIFASLPGFADWRYQRATPTEQKQMKADEWYFRTLQDISKRANSGKEFYDLMHQNPAFMAEYWRRNPDKKAEYDANQEYVRWMGSWVSKLQADDFVGAQAVWDSMPAWVKERYFAKHPDSGMRDGMGAGDGGGLHFRSEESRQRYLMGQAYYASMGTWVALLKAKEFVKADAYFRSLPAWMKEKYYTKHPDQRAKNELDSAALRYGAEYFLASGDDKLKILQKYPQLRAWLAEHGGDEAAHRGLIMAMYRAIPSSEPWLKRTFRQRFPEIFSVEAQGQRRLDKVARKLAEHPEMEPYYWKALALQQGLYIEQLKHSKVTPRPWQMERKRRLVKRSKRRAARLHSHWTLHRDIRKYRD